MMNRKARRKAEVRGKKRRKPLTAMEQTLMDRHMRQVYIWRYSVNEESLARQMEGGHAVGDDHGYNMLSLAKRDQVDAAYTIATNTRLHWQAVAIFYCRDHAGDEFRLWSWVKTQVPIVARGDGIVPLLHEAHSRCDEDRQESEVVEARAIILAPWDSRHPIRPEVLAARLKTRLRLTDAEIQELGDWGEPSVSRIEESEHLDLEVARALRGR